MKKTTKRWLIAGGVVCGILMFICMSLAPVSGPCYTDPKTLVSYPGEFLYPNALGWGIAFLIIGAILILAALFVPEEVDFYE